MSFFKRDIHHINVNVPNVEQSIKFYTDVMGYELKATYELNGMKFAFVSDGNLDYELVEKSDIESAIFDHLAYVSSNIKADYTYFQALDPNMVTTPIGEADFSPEFGLYYFFIKGFGGERIEFCQNK